MFVFLGVLLLTSPAHSQETGQPAGVPVVAPIQPGEPAKYQVWVEDSLVKVLESHPMPDDASHEIVLHMARGEREDAQIVVRPTESAIAWLSVSADKLNKQGSEATLAAPIVRYVDHVPLHQNSEGSPPSAWVAKAPAWVPDPLWDMPNSVVRKDKSRACWLTFATPIDAQPGTYTGEARVRANEVIIPLPITVHVHEAVVPQERSLKVTNWANQDMLARWFGVEIWSEDFWQIVRKVARNLAEHRQNMILCPISTFWATEKLIDISVDGDKLAFDFSRFDRWIEIFREEGVVGYIEGGHIGHGGRVHVWLPRDGELVHSFVPATTPEATEYLSQFFTALQAHLEEKGWVDIYYQHIMDEPNDATEEMYNAAMNLLRKHAPKLRSMDALLSAKVTTADVLVPILYLRDHGNLHDNFEEFKALQEQGKELWYYVCGAVQGTYVCRHLDHYLLRTRYMPWLCFKYDLTGFLHWGYNWWDNASPFTQTQVTYSHHGGFPPGDHDVVYPGPNRIIDSIRWEAHRDGVEDYELLKQLEKTNPDLARAICDRMIRDFDDYEMDIARFREARLELIRALAP